MNPVAVGPGVVRLAPRLRRRWWWWAAGAVVVVGAGTVAWRMTHAGVTIPASDLYTVRYGTVTQTVATTGTLQAPKQVALSFLASGQLKALDVSVGQHVQAGQTLAQLNDATIAPQVAQAQAQLASAQAALQKAEEGPTPQAVAVAQANLQHAQVVLQGAQQQYQDEQAIFNDRLSAQQSVQQAQDQVNQDAAALQAAEVGLAKAQNALQQAQVGVNTSALNSISYTIQQDQDLLTAAEQQLSNDQQTLAAEQADETAAQNVYNEYLTLWGNLDPNTYAQAQADVAEGNGAATGFSTSTGVSMTAQQYVTAYTTDSGALSQLQSAQQLVAKTQQAIDADYAQIQQAQANLTNAQNQQANLAQMNPLTVQAAQIAVQQAQASVNQAQAAYQAAENGLALAQQLYNDRTAAQAQLDQAANAVAQAQNGVTQAQAQ
ncbi:MAG: biotin/lipoyl-binding protein, partial [Actinomycetia bacterium]|nr:biotin/lipoyl-binding protein [Actinomycetes bacterium]